LLFGATESVGKYILAGIVDSKSPFGRIAIFTSENQKDEILIWKQKGVEVILGDITNGSHITKAYEGMPISHTPTQNNKKYFEITLKLAI
jgi:hypothetical protein